MTSRMFDVDVVIVGGGPAGLAAALNLGRARKRVLLCDAGPRRNAAAEHIHGFVTQDGTPPAEFRRIAREQLHAYPNVEARDVAVAEIRINEATAGGGDVGRGFGGFDGFEVRLATDDVVSARRVLLCVGMIDELPAIEGYRELWGRSIVQCPYCHGWEVQDRAFGYLAPSAAMLDFAIFLRGWTRSIVALTNGAFEVPEEMKTKLAAAGVPLDERRIARLRAIGVGGDDSNGRELDRIEFEEGSPLRIEVLFAKPPQRQVPLVQSLGLALSSAGFVELNDHRQTSIPGIYAAGDLVSGMQSATLGAASGAQAAVMLNHELTMELAMAGELVQLARLA